MQKDCVGKVKPEREAKEGRGRSWNEIEQEAFGEMGLKPWEFYRMTWSEYFNTVKGRQVRFEKDNLLIRRLIVDHFNANIDSKKSSPITDEKLFPFSIDKDETAKPKTPPMSAEERREFLRKKAEGYGLKVLDENGKLKIDGT